jgi:hypothetical protein
VAEILAPTAAQLLAEMVSASRRYFFLQAALRALLEPDRELLRFQDPMAAVRAERARAAPMEAVRSQASIYAGSATMAMDQSQLAAVTEASLIWRQAKAALLHDPQTPMPPVMADEK